MGRDDDIEQHIYDALRQEYWNGYEDARFDYNLPISNTGGTMTDKTSIKPTPGRIVWYTSRTGNYFLPAMVMVTEDNLHRPGVDAGHVPDLSGDLCCHLWVFSPGPTGLSAKATDFKTESPHGRQENLGGGYVEFDIAYQSEGAPGTWRWPDRA